MLKAEAAHDVAVYLQKPQQQDSCKLKEGVTAEQTLLLAWREYSNPYDSVVRACRLQERVAALQSMVDSQMEAEGWEAEGPVPADPDKLSPAHLHRMMQVGSTDWQCAGGWGLHSHSWPLPQTGSGRDAGACLTEGPSATSWQHVQSAGAF